MFLKTVKKQGEEIFRLEETNKKLKENIDELETEKEQLKVYFNDIGDKVISILDDIQTINQMRISQYEKNKRINALIFNLNRLLSAAKIL